MGMLLVIAVLFLITIFGHGLWVLCAAILRGLGGGDTTNAQAEPSRRFTECPACGDSADSRALDCRGCGLFLNSPTAHRLRRVRTAIREVRDLAESEALNAEAAQPVIARLERRIRVLRGLPADPAPPPITPPSEAPPAPIPAVVVEVVPEPILATVVETPPAADSPPEVIAVPVPATPPPVTPPPRRGSLLSAFMEEKNILWGELAGGLLIVGCSIALVVTLWSSLEAIPYFPFLLAAGITLALFGAGEYTLHHWRLTSTSRGLLVISLLLVPLNVLLLADTMERLGKAGAFEIGVKLVAVLVFVGVVRTGGRDLLRGQRWRSWLAVAVVGAPAMLLLPTAWFDGLLPFAPALLPLAFFALGCLVVLRTGTNRDEPLEPPVAIALLQFVGLAAFALLTAWGLHVARSPDTADRLRSLAVPLSLAAVVVVEAGLLVQSRVTSSTGLRVTGTAVALTGFVAMTGALAAAWPQPLAVLLVSLAVGSFLTRIAFREALPWAQVGAIPALALAVVVGFHGIAGQWGEPLAELVGSAPSGAVLAGFALLLAGLSELLARKENPAGAASYALGGLAVGLVALLLVSVNGMEHPATAAAVHGACALGLLASNVRWGLRVVAHGGLWLVLVGSLWALQATVPGAMDCWGFVVALESFAFAALALGLKGHREGAVALLRRAGRDVGFVAAILAPMLAAFAPGFPHSPYHTGGLFALALSGLTLARLTGRPLLTYAGSVAALLGFVHLTTSTLEWQPTTRAVIVGLLTHATVAVVVAGCLRRLRRVFADPLMWSAALSSLLAVPLLLFPPADRAAEWAGCAAWLALLGLTIALLWRARLAFSAFQAALSLAVVLLGVAWVHGRELVPPERTLAYWQPVALHVYAVALGLLALVWIAARRTLRNNATFRELWLDQVRSVDRGVLTGLVIGQFLLAAFAVLPEVRAELASVGSNALRRQPAELAQAFGAGAWVLLGVLAVAVLASFRLTTRRDDTDAHLVGLTLLLLTTPILWAGSHAADVASATALRWGLATAFLVGSGLLLARVPLQRGFVKLGFPVQPTGHTKLLLLAMFAVAAGVVVYLSAQVAEIGLTGRKASGPTADSAFAAMGAIPANLLPLVLVVLGLAGTAGRERSAGYAFAGGVVFTATAAAGYALGIVTGGGSIGAGEQVKVALIVAGAAASWALLWHAAERRVPGRNLLVAQSWFGLGWLACLAAIPAAVLIVQPTTSFPLMARALGWYGAIPLALAVVAAGLAARKQAQLRLHALFTTALIVGVLVACIAHHWREQQPWVSFHALAASWAVVGVGVMVAARRTGAHTTWLDGLAAALTVLALSAGRTVWDDPIEPTQSWLAAALAVLAAALIGTATTFTRATWRMIASGFLVNLAAVFVWLTYAPDTETGFLLANAIGLGVASAVWTVVLLRDPEPRWLHITNVARGVGLAFLAIGVLPTLAGDRADPPWLSWGATLAVALATAAALWNREARIARGGLFAVGVVAVLLAVSATTTAAVWNVWQSPVALGMYAAFGSVLVLLAARATKPVLRLPEHGSWDWLLAGQAVVAGIVILLGVRIGLMSPELWERLASPGSVLLLVFAAGLLPRGVPTRAALVRHATLALGVLVFATAAWAGPDPHDVAPWLQRNAWLFVALAAAALLGSECGPRLRTDWQVPARTVGGLAAAVAVGVLCVNLLQQVPVFDPVTRRTPLPAAVVFAMLAAIVGLIALALRFALSQERDPLRLPECRRTVYVYLAEMLLVLLFTHIRLNVPELFLGGVVRYWTFAVMALAFVGIGLAEYFERRKIDVLAGPLRRTGVLLPLIPLLAFWAKPPAELTEFAHDRAAGLSPFLGYLQNLPQHFDTYAWLWALAGVLYGLVALSRKSFGWALLAALATNAALWSVLAHTGVPFFLHPQAWVIPLALIVLVSEHINRAKLRPELSAGLRYLGVTMIYMASAADMFIAGVGESLWLPVILAVLCVAGILLGIMTRVNAFVFLGLGFLLLDVFAMIWHAAVNLNQTWVWYASGIVLGVAILVLFAVFENRKRSRTDAE